jgi:hypothetical protein
MARRRHLAGHSGSGLTTPAPLQSQVADKQIQAINAY